MPTIPVDYERLVQEVYEAVLRPGDTAVDVGAHVGRHTLPMAECVAPGGRVLAVEPLPSCRQTLRQTLLATFPELKDLVQVLACALADRPGRADFTVADDWPAFSGLRPVPYPAPTPTSALPVEVETLDGLCAGLDALRYLKVDAEGAELHILRGGLDCLHAFRPAVGFEFGTFSNREYGVAPEDMASFWAEAGYDVYAITGEALPPADFVRAARRREIWDYVAVPAEDAETSGAVRAALRRPRVNWLAVRAELAHAADHAGVGERVPPLTSFRGPLRPLARAAAWLYLQAARMITAPQSLHNRSLLWAVRHLVDGLEAAERGRREQARRVQELEARLGELERAVARRRDTPEGARGGGAADH